jgi:hypothetical protein
MKQLCDSAVRIAIRGAHEYLRVHDLKADPDPLANSILQRVKERMPEALDDATKAVQCNMHQVAEATFRASMIQAGIDAAKDVAGMEVAA